MFPRRGVARSRAPARPFVAPSCVRRRPAETVDDAELAKRAFLVGARQIDDLRGGKPFA